VGDRSRRRRRAKFCSLAAQCKRRMSEARSRLAARLECEPQQGVAITAPAAAMGQVASRPPSGRAVVNSRFGRGHRTQELDRWLLVAVCPSRGSIELYPGALRHPRVPRGVGDQDRNPEPEHSRTCALFRHVRAPGHETQSYRALIGRAAQRGPPYPPMRGRRRQRDDCSLPDKAPPYGHQRQRED
jgi:hypothetical protein